MVKPPYFAVIFTSLRTKQEEGYAETAARMLAAVEAQPGYLGSRHFSNEEGFQITISYWENEASLKAWKQVASHQTAQQLGQSTWYAWYSLEVCEVKRAYAFGELPKP